MCFVFTQVPFVWYEILTQDLKPFSVTHMQWWRKSGRWQIFFHATILVRSTTCSGHDQPLKECSWTTQVNTVCCPPLQNTTQQEKWLVCGFHWILVINIKNPQWVGTIAHFATNVQKEFQKQLSDTQRTKGASNTSLSSEVLTVCLRNKERLNTLYVLLYLHLLLFCFRHWNMMSASILFRWNFDISGFNSPCCSSQPSREK